MSRQNLFRLTVSAPFLVLLCLGASTSFGQATSRHDSLKTAEAYYANKVRTFTTQNREFKRVVLVGDSLTEDFNLGIHFPQRNIINRGIGSDVVGYPRKANDSRGLIRRLESSVFETGANHVYLMIGINDVLEGAKVDDIVEGYRRILAAIRARAPQTIVHVQSLLPMSGYYATYNDTVRELNSRLRTLAAEFAYPFVDLHFTFVDANGQLRSAYSTDGIHLNSAGYAAWAQRIKSDLGW